ncbi:hypothetical protein HanPSC8_Chr17g0758481 [Helianthus annuus]|nr:hypothetical protein HanPSC8_Chr17g0758481 [Helianthus annuus]
MHNRGVFFQLRCCSIFSIILPVLFDGGIRRGTDVFKADRSGYTCGYDCGNIFSHVYATGRNMLVQMRSVEKASNAMALDGIIFEVFLGINDLFT